MRRRVIYITGMSGTGKSTIIGELSQCGYRAVDTDSDLWSRYEGDDWILREDKMNELLSQHSEGALFIAGCKTNQGLFYSRFDHIVLLSAPARVLFERIDRRANNPYGKRPEEKREILKYIDEVEPLLRASATREIDATLPLNVVVEKLEALL